MMPEARRGAVRGMRSDEMENSDEAPFGGSSLPLAEAGRLAVCGGMCGLPSVALAKEGAKVPGGVLRK